MIVEADLNALLERMYCEGGSYEGPLTPEDFGVCYSDAYINRIDEGDGMMQYSLPKSLRHLEQSLDGVLHEFDTIVVSGLSGVIPGAIIAHKYNKQLVVVRKDDDITHGTRTEGKDHFKEGTPYIVLDDFICSGRTMTRILTKMQDLGYGLPKYVCLYRGSMWKPVDMYGTEKVQATHVQHGLYAPTLVKE